MKEHHSPHSIRSEGFPYVPRPAKPVTLHLYHVFALNRISIASCTQDYTCHQSSNSAHPPQSARTLTSITVDTSSPPAYTAQHPVPP